ncbi:hypothetical protein PsYK624_109040 [Phanerochaete sordida]|uniref:Uncharacterized protein n=1 Tax=Phanerochaete sordida TaxID=48140 RepID=A0A9P3GGY6_9APHY|nr:hypothetical protein PsYK624_109040 [Phanerochaete sordida]
MRNEFDHYTRNSLFPCHAISSTYACDQVISAQLHAQTSGTACIRQAFYESMPNLPAVAYTR